MWSFKPVVFPTHNSYIVVSPFPVFLFLFLSCQLYWGLFVLVILQTCICYLSLCVHCALGLALFSDLLCYNTYLYLLHYSVYSVYNCVRNPLINPELTPASIAAVVISSLDQITASHCSIRRYIITS